MYMQTNYSLLYNVHAFTAIKVTITVLEVNTNNVHLTPLVYVLAP